MRGMGTPEYAPPEQYDAHMGHTDPRSDLYGLGTTLYHALTGQSPPTATLRIADPEQFTPIAAMLSHVQTRTQTGILKAMELGRSQRWASALQMAEALGVSIPLWQPINGQAAVSVGNGDGRGGTRKMEEESPFGGESCSVNPGNVPQIKRRGVSWLYVALFLLLVISGGVFGGGSLLSGRPTHTALPTLVTEEPSTAVVLAVETSTPTRAPTATRTPTPTMTATRTPALLPEATIAPTLTPTQKRASITIPVLKVPVQGQTYQNPLPFEWEGRLESGQTYIVQAWSLRTGYAIQSPALTTTSWAYNVPGDSYGEWKCTVSVIEGGRTLSTSNERLFWFNPFPDDGGGLPAPTTPSAPTDPPNPGYPEPIDPPYPGYP